MINPHKWIRNLTKTWRVSKRKKTITGLILPLADTAASRSLNPDMSLITFSFRFVKRKMMNELFLKKPLNLIYKLLKFTQYKSFKLRKIDDYEILKN